jgi:hypothetical protein
LKKSFINSNPHLHKEKEMVEFRKAFLTLAVLVFATGIASAQINPLQCTANAGVPPIARAEGVAEEVGQVIINCTGGVSTPSPDLNIPTINVQIFLNTNITSRLLDSTGTRSEALLLIDEPQPSEQIEAASVPNVATIKANGNGVYKNGMRPTVFGAQQASPNSLVWLNIPFDPPGTSGNRVIRLVNVRANANQLGVGSSLIPNQISMFISISGTASLALNNPQLTVAFIQPGMKFSATSATYNQCEPGIKSYDISFTELFGTAFRHQRSTGNQNIPGSIYNTESMFYSSAFTTVGAVNAGLATQGTRLSARFSNVPANVTITVPVSIDNHVRVTSGTPPVPVITQRNDAATLVPSGTNGSTASATTGVVTLTGGAGAAVWEVTESNPGAILALKATVSVEYKANPLPGLGTATVAGNYAPVAATLTASTEAAPRFVENPQSATTFTINSCRTNLLFPFVSNAAGFDTGIAISNTSKDPFGTVPQRGACTLNYYSATNTPAAQTSSTINEGEQLVFNLSLGNATQNVTPTPGFQGYIIATCNFQYAHGYAFLSTPTQGGLSNGYLALVMDKNMFGMAGLPATRSGATSEPLDN